MLTRRSWTVLTSRFLSVVLTMSCAALPKSLVTKRGSARSRMSTWRHAHSVAIFMPCHASERVLRQWKLSEKLDQDERVEQHGGFRDCTSQCRWPRQLHLYEFRNYARRLISTSSTMWCVFWCGWRDACAVCARSVVCAVCLSLPLPTLSLSHTIALGPCVVVCHFP